MKTTLFFFSKLSLNALDFVKTKRNEKKRNKIPLRSLRTKSRRAAQGAKIPHCHCASSSKAFQREHEEHVLKVSTTRSNKVVSDVRKE